MNLIGLSHPMFNGHPKIHRICGSNNKSNESNSGGGNKRMIPQ